MRGRLSAVAVIVAIVVLALAFALETGFFDGH
jgi:hypothetical protein